MLFTSTPNSSLGLRESDLNLQLTDNSQICYMDTPDNYSENQDCDSNWMEPGNNSMENVCIF